MLTLRTRMPSRPLEEVEAAVAVEIDAVPNRTSKGQAAVEDSHRCFVHGDENNQTSIGQSVPISR